MTLKPEKIINWSRLWTSWKDYNSDGRGYKSSFRHVSACYPCHIKACYDCWHINRSIGLTRSCWNRLGPCRITETRQREDHFLLQRHNSGQLRIIIIVHEKSIRHWMKMMFRIYISRLVVDSRQRQRHHSRRGLLPFTYIVYRITMFVCFYGHLCRRK